MITMKIENGADVDSTNVLEMTPLHIASHKGKAGVVKYLLENGAEVDTKEKYGFTPLWLASGRGHLESVKYLIEFKAEVNIKCTMNNYLPLHIAAQKDHIEVDKLFV